MTQNPVLLKFHRHLFRSQVYLKCYHHLTVAIFQICIELNLNAQMNCQACHKEFMAQRKGHDYTPGLELYCHMVCCPEYQELGECFTPFVHWANVLTTQEPSSSAKIVTFSIWIRRSTKSTTHATNLLLMNLVMANLITNLPFLTSNFND